MVKEIELQYEIILSKGKGVLTQNASNLLIELAKGIHYKMALRYPPSQREDVLSNGILDLFINYHRFDPQFGTNAVAYFTEIYKRSCANYYNKYLKNKTISFDEII